jgi:hypothetical protein
MAFDTADIILALGGWHDNGAGKGFCITLGKSAG